jgi:hypothetical protein
MGQPEHAHPPQAQAHPVAMGGTMLGQQGLEPQALQMGQSQGNIIDTFRRQIQRLGHGSRSLPLEPAYDLTRRVNRGASRRLMTDGYT